MTDSPANDPGVKNDPPANEPGVVEVPVNEDVNIDPRKNPLYGRLAEITAKNKALTESLDKIERDREKVRKAGLEKQGEFKTLLEESKAENESLVKERDAAVDKWDTYESDRREALTAELSDDDKTLAMKMTDLAGMEAFIKRIAGKDITSTDTRRGVSNLQQGKLKPLTEMTDQEKRETHEARISQYVS